MGFFGKSKRTMVVDVDSILKSKGVRGRPAPRQQLQVLRSLSRLVQREKVNVTAVIAGQQLNKAPHNKQLEGVRVRYAKSEETVGSELLKAFSQAGAGGVLITSESEIEKKVLRSGGDTLRLSTFRKLIDDGNEGGGPNGGGNRDRNNNNRNRRDRGDRGPRPERKKPRPQAPKQPKEPKEQDEISQMIDLVE